MNFSFNYTFSFSAQLGMLAVLGILFFLYLQNLSDLLKVVRERNRTIKPSSVWWLSLSAVTTCVSTFSVLFIGNYPILVIVAKVLYYTVSLFIVIWYFKIVKGIAISVEAEFDSREIVIESRPSYQTGMIMTVSLLLTLLIEIPYIGFIGALAALSSSIGWVAYWMRTHKLKKKLQALPQHHDEESLIFNDLN